MAKKQQTADQLRAKAKAAQNAVFEAEKKERQDRNGTLVGKTFKYRNSGGGEEQWWLFAKVQRIRNGLLLLFKFEHTPYGINIEISNPRTSLSDGYIEIPKAEFVTEWRKLQNIINAVSI